MCSHCSSGKDVVLQLEQGCALSCCVVCVWRLLLWATEFVVCVTCAGPVAPTSSSGRSDTDLEEQTLRMTSGKKVRPPNQDMPKQNSR